MILIIGATGFIGRYLVMQLTNEGREVIATGRSREGEIYYKKRNIPFVRLDITKNEDFDTISVGNVDAVVHLASLIPRAAKGATAVDYMMVNGIGTYNSLDYCRKNRIHKFIYTTSLFEIQNRWTGSEQTPLSEELPFDFKYSGNHATYIISKIAGHHYVKHFTTEYGIQGLIYRLTGVHGLGSYPGTWEMFIEKASRSEPIEIWGDNTLRRDNMYVKDVVNAIIAGLNSNYAVGLYNIGSGEGLTVEDEAKKIIKIFSPQGKPSKLIYRPDKPGIPSSHVFDISKAKKELEWTPKYSYEAMLEDYKKELIEHSDWRKTYGK